MTKGVVTPLPTFALSVRQPWAWAIINAGKDVENRSRRAISLGRMDSAKRVAVHASSGMTREEYEDARDFMASIGVDCPRPDRLVRGAIVGAVSVDGIVKESGSRWFFGPWALMLSDPASIDPIPCKGELGLFQWSGRKALDLAAPLPWMVAWPDRAIRSKPPPPAALLL